MAFGQSYRDNPLNWSLRLGQAFGIRIRVHLLFFLMVIILLARAFSNGSFGFSAVIIVFLFWIVLIHEFGHCFGARYVGGDAEEILMWPLGGLATVNPPMKARAHFITTAAGPLVNVIFCVLTALVVLVVSGSTRSIPLNPFHLFVVSSISVTRWSMLDWLVVFWSVNYMLLLFNLLPTYPMDGGRLLQAILWRYQGYQRSMMTATLVGMIGAVAFGLVGLIQEELLLVCIAVFGYITCMQQRQMLRSGAFEAGNEWGYDFSKGYGAFDEAQQAERKPSWLQRRHADKQARKEQRERERQLALEREIDHILEKVHENGVQSLTAREKKLLESETQRKQHP